MHFDGERSVFVRLSKEEELSETNLRSSHTVSPLQGGATTTTAPVAAPAVSYVPSVVSGINTSGSYHVYAHPQPLATATTTRLLLSSLPREGAASQQSLLRRSPAPSGNVPVATPSPSSTHHHHPSHLHHHHQHMEVGPGPSPAAEVRCPPAAPGFGKEPAALGLPAQLPHGVQQQQERHPRPQEGPAGCEDDNTSAAKARNWKKYRFIVMNQAAGGEDDDRGGDGGASGPYFGASSQYKSEGSDAHGEESPAGEGEAGAEDQGFPVSPLAARHQSHGCSREISPQLPDAEPYSPASYSSEDANKVRSENYHSSSEGGNNAFFCNECDSKFPEADSLKSHMLQDHSDKPYRCDSCQAAFRYKGNLASHKTFNRPANLKTHTRIHSGEKPYKCETCGSRFVQCEKCDLHFRHKSQLRLHLRQKHGAVTNTKAPYRRTPPSTAAALGVSLAEQTAS
ncbi:hypothetical protein CRUP_033358 [Coryphaenoides rupestris]|nr:hypothetical protein CRUP_033358 [Coryphaenoides rupestris]